MAGHVRRHTPRRVHVGVHTGHRPTDIARAGYERTIITGNSHPHVRSRQTTASPQILYAGRAHPVGRQPCSRPVSRALCANGCRTPRENVPTTVAFSRRLRRVRSRVAATWPRRLTRSYPAQLVTIGPGHARPLTCEYARSFIRRRAFSFAAFPKMSRTLQKSASRLKPQLCTRRVPPPALFVRSFTALVGSLSGACHVWDPATPLPRTNSIAYFAHSLHSGADSRRAGEHETNPNDYNARLAHTPKRLPEHLPEPCHNGHRGWSTTPSEPTPIMCSRQTLSLPHESSTVIGLDSTSFARCQTAPVRATRTC